LQRAAAAGWRAWSGGDRAAARGAVALVLAAVAVAAVGLPRIRWTDDIKLLTVIDPEMLAEDERVRERVARMDGGRFVVAIGSGADVAAAEAAALDVNDGCSRRWRGAGGGRARGVSQPAHLRARAGGAAAQRGGPARAGAAGAARRGVRGRGF
jgi:hypothetical protein